MKGEVGKNKRENLPQKCLLYTVRLEVFPPGIDAVPEWKGGSRAGALRRVPKGIVFNTRRHHMNR